MRDLSNVPSDESSCVVNAQKFTELTGSTLLEESAAFQQPVSFPKVELSIVNVLSTGAKQ